MDIPLFYRSISIPIPMPFKPLERHVSIKRREWSFPQSTAAMGRTCSLTFQGRQGQEGPNDRVAICLFQIQAQQRSKVQNHSKPLWRSIESWLVHDYILRMFYYDPYKTGWGTTPTKTSNNQWLFKMVGHCSSGGLSVEKLGSRSTEALRFCHMAKRSVFFVSEINSNVDFYLVVEPTHLKNMSQNSKWESSPNRGENKKMLKPPPSDLIEKYPPEV